MTISQSRKWSSQVSNAAFAKASTILDILAETGVPQHVERLERQAHIKRNSLEKIIELLAYNGWVTRKGDLVGLGASVRDWGFAALSLDSLPEKAGSLLFELYEKTGLDGCICVYAPPSIVFVKKSGFTHHPNAPQIGAPYPAHLMANGRAVLATFPRAYLDQYISTFLADVPDEWVNERVIQPVEQTRKRGFGLTTSDRFSNVDAISFPIFGASDEAVGVISLWRPIDELGAQASEDILSFLPILQLLSERLSRSLGAGRAAA
jgi:DNA-binding IclR family transcriptional regulator